MRELFDHLHSIGIIQSDGVSRSFIREMPFARLIELVEFIGGIGRINEVPIAQTPFSFSASLTLSGGPTDCASIRCRTARVDEMSRFALLFADCVYIRNPFSECLPEYLHAPIKDSEELRERLVAEFMILLQLRPLLEAGLVVFFVSPANQCLSCFAKSQLSPDVARRLSSAYRKLSKRYAEELEVAAEILGPGHAIHVSGPEFLLEHGQTAFLSPVPHPQIAAMSRLQKKLKAGEKVKLSKAAWRRMGLHQRFSNLVSLNVQHHLAVSQALNASLLTHSSLHLSFLRDALGNSALEERNRAIKKHLTAAIPFLESVPIPRLLDLRAQEGDAFQVFRSSVLDAANAVKGPSVDFTERDARHLYGDVLRPGLARLEERVRLARREPLVNAAKSAAGVALALSFGLYFGLVPAELQAALNALGILKVAGDLATKAGDAINPSRAIRTESLYFLWRAQRLVEKD